MKNKLTYNTFSLIVFLVLIIGTFSFFSFADTTDLTLFEDFDRDGLSNAEEIALNTDPRNPDTDGDSYTDGVEVESGYNPLIPAPNDRIVAQNEPTQFKSISTQTSNVTKKIAEEVVSYIADAQESGDTDISSEEFSEVINHAVDNEVVYADVPPVDLDEIILKDQNYEKLSKREREEQMKNDAIEYFTAISYVFVTNFPNGFFDRPIEDFQTEVMMNVNNFTDSLTSFGYFENMAKHALTAEDQIYEIEVPEEMIEIHTQSLYLVRYMSTLYEDGSYKNVSTDTAPMIATLAQMQELIQESLKLQEKIQEKVEQYGIDTSLLLTQ